MAASLHELIDAYLGMLENERRLSPYTVRNYRASLSLFETFLFDHLGKNVQMRDLAALEARDFRAFLADRRRAGVDASSLRLDLSAIKGFFKFLTQRHGLTNAALPAVRAPKMPKRLPRPVAHKDILEMIEDAGEQQNWKSGRDAAILTLLYGAGLRISEALSLGWQDDFSKEMIVITGKGNKQRQVPLLPVIRQAIIAYRDRLSADPVACHFPVLWQQHKTSQSAPLFYSDTGKSLSARMVQSKMQALRTKMGLPKTATPHALRHSFATQLLSRGADLRAVQELLGHRSLAATQRYTEIDTEGLLATFNKAHPRQRLK